MAVAQTLHTMTLGHPNKMYNVIQHSPSQSNCVIVSTGMTQQTGKSVIQNKRPLAPAPERNSVLVNNTDLRCKRKIQFMPYGGPSQQPASVARRNARERNRVKQVNNGFATLRSHIPSNVLTAIVPPSTPGTGRGASKKLSKVETLRLAVEYIRSLQQMISDHESDKPEGAEGLMENGYYTSNPDAMEQYGGYPVLLPTPPSSEASSSPTPSHSSEASMSGNSTYATQLYQEGYENYDPKSPEDEELLDAIFSWQQNE